MLLVTVKQNPNSQNIKLLIAGSGPEKNNLLKLIENLKIAECIIWIDFTDDVGSIFKQIDVLCMNSSLRD